MTSYQQLFSIGEAFESFVSRGLPNEINAVRMLQQKLTAPAAVSDDTRRRISAIVGRFHLLTAGEMWCPDCQINLTAMDYLQRIQPGISVAIISKSRAEHALKQRLALERISIPLVLVLDDAFEVVGRFVERPQAVIAVGETIEADYRAGECLESTLQELLDIIERLQPAN